MRRLALLTLAPIAAALALPATAFAHPRIVTATPLANSTVVKPTSLSLTFTEALVAPLSGIELTMTGMPGMAKHQPMPIRGFVTKVTDKTMAVKLPRALPAGAYLLSWHAVATDQHRVQGSYAFTVR